jgi:outer membrane protein W
MKTRFWIAILSISTIATAAYAGTPYNVDDPGTTEVNHTAVSLNYFSTQVLGSEAQSAPNITVTYGKTPNLELDLLTGLTTARASGTDRQTGFGDTTVGARWRFVEETRRAPQVGLAYFLKIPTASVTRGLGTGKADHLLYLMSAKSYGKAYVFGQAGCCLPGAAGQKNNAVYGLAATYQTTEKLTLGVQLYGNTTPADGVPGELAYGVGLTDNYAANQALLVAVSHSTRGLCDCNLYAGVTWTLGPTPKPVAPQAPSSELPISHQ